MSVVHGMSIPDPDMVVDLQSFVGYLATEVRAWHECLYCGATKDSTSSIQNHMRDKGHCLLNFDREPELLDFWEYPEQDDEDSGPPAPETQGPTTLSATEIRLASGRLIGSRHATLEGRKHSARRDPAASATKGPGRDTKVAESSSTTSGVRLAPGRQLARREEMSMVGVSLQQRQALASAEKKAQRSEAVANRAREWILSRAANSQKFDQADNQMKWGKQNHKLQPR